MACSWDSRQLGRIHKRDDLRKSAREHRAVGVRIDRSNPCVECAGVAGCLTGPATLPSSSGITSIGCRKSQADTHRYTENQSSGQRLNPRKGRLSLDSICGRSNGITGYAGQIAVETLVRADIDQNAGRIDANLRPVSA